MRKKWTESLKKTKPFTIKGLQVKYIPEKRVIIFFQGDEIALLTHRKPKKGYGKITVTSMHFAKNASNCHA